MPHTRQQLVNLNHLLRRQSRENFLQIGIRIMTFQTCRLYRAHDRRARLPMRSDPEKSQFLRPRAHGLIRYPVQRLSVGMALSSR